MLLKYQRFSFLINISCLIGIMTVSAILLNRSFFIGALSGFVFLIISYHGIKFNSTKFFYSLILISFSLLVVSLFFKSDSSLGRLLIYKISWQMFLDHPIEGIGIGNFQREYGLYQAEYFRCGVYTQKELLLADNTFYAFNDYWEFIIERGAKGAVYLLISINLLIRLVIFCLNNDPENGLVRISSAILLVIGIAAFFTHVFEERVFKVIVVLIISYLCIFSIDKSLVQNYRCCLALFFTFGFIIFQYSYEVRNRVSYEMWDRAKVLSATGYVLESQRLFTELYPKLYGDISFLNDYNNTLSGVTNLNKKKILLEKITERYSDNLSYLKLATIYEDLGLNKDAESAYLKSIFIVPNRFVTKFAIYNFYLKNKEYEKSNHWKEVILTMPVKVPSERIELIKQTLKLETLNKSTK